MEGYLSLGATKKQKKEHGSLRINKEKIEEESENITELCFLSIAVL